MCLRFLSFVLCVSFLFELSYGGVIGSDGRPGQIPGKGAQRRYQHIDLDVAKNLTKDEDEEDLIPMMQDTAKGDEVDDKVITAPIVGLQIDYFQIESKILSRFATTVVSSRVKNWEPNATEVAFSVVLPEEAFIANFTMLIKNTTIVGEVKEKEAAKATYEAARAAGQSAGHVEQSPRRTNAFIINVNVGGEEKVEFQLTYQEVLTRTNDYYKHVINIRPGQIVKRMKLILDVQEDTTIKKFHIPKIAKDIGDMTNEQLLKMNDWSSELEITQDFKKNASHLILQFAPTDKQQREYSANGINGQFVFLYDVERPEGGELKAVNGYFVHFFAPEIADPVPKQVIFVIDQSRSMKGAKLKQTKEAMNVILKDLSIFDYFNILTFSDATSYWTEESQSANPDSLHEAQTFVNQIEIVGGTNINSALLTALDMLNANSTKNFDGYQPVIIFLTDGQANSGVIREDHILRNIAEKRRRENQVAIHSISFGTGADFGLLKKISTRNGGLARKIYEDSDAAIQLHSFYSEISHPLLTHIKINYLNETVDPDSIVSGDNKVYYKGSEVVTIGKLKDFSEEPEDEDHANSIKVMMANISGFGREKHRYQSECIILPLPRPPRPFPIGVEAQDDDPLPASSLGGFVERVWAYKTIKQMLKSAENQVDNADKKKELKDKALALSIKYNFVTELTSMVVVMQNDEKIVPRFAEEKNEDSSNNLQMQMSTWSGRPTWSGGPDLPGYFQGRPIGRHHSHALEFTGEDDTDSYEDILDMAENVTLSPSNSMKDFLSVLCSLPNEMRVTCLNSLVCNIATCETMGMTIEPQITCTPPLSCDNGTTCVCNEGYVRLNGECVEPSNCRHLNCSDNEMLNPCGNVCERNCSLKDEPQPCMNECELPTCSCKLGYFRNDKNECVTEKECEKKVSDEFFL